MELEKTAVTSPLLSEPVIQRDYTAGIENQFQEGFQSKQPTDADMNKGGDGDFTGEKQQPQGQRGQSNDPFAEPSSTGFADFENPKGFEFDQDTGDQSDVGDGDAAGFDLSATSAKQFANITGDILKTQVPKMVHNSVKVDIPNIRYHVNAGNMHPQMVDAFSQVNNDVFEELQWSDDEIKMWKKAFQAWLEEKNIAAANATTGLILASVSLGVPMMMKAKGIKKSITNSINDSIRSYNPAFFESYEAKTTYKDDPKKSDSSPSEKSENKEAEKSEPKTEKEKL